MEDLENEYFEWLCGIVYDDDYRENFSYKKLLAYLHNTPFVYSIEMDSNRAEDGIALRYRFGRRCGYSQGVISTVLDTKTFASVLEVMIALSIRCEEQIMANPNYGDRTGQWFWNMITSLGIGSMTDDRFLEPFVMSNIQRFLKRNYDLDGRGGLFTVPGRTDMRQTEIWYQMCYYLDTIVD